MTVKPLCTPGDVYVSVDNVHHAYMATKVRPRFKKPLRRTFFREWREYRKLTLEVAADRIGTYLQDNGIAKGYTYQSLLRLEHGEFAYKQPILEAMAYVYRTDEASLLMRNPTNSESLWSIWDHAKEGDRQKIVDIAKTIVGKTGTEG